MAGWRRTTEARAGLVHRKNGRSDETQVALRGFRCPKDPRSGSTIDGSHRSCAPAHRCPAPLHFAQPDRRATETGQFFVIGPMTLCHSGRDQPGGNWVVFGPRHVMRVSTVLRVPTVGQHVTIVPHEGLSLRCAGSVRAVMTEGACSSPDALGKTTKRTPNGKSHPEASTSANRGGLGQIICPNEIRPGKSFCVPMLNRLRRRMSALQVNRSTARDRLRSIFCCPKWFAPRSRNCRRKKPMTIPRWGCHPCRLSGCCRSNLRND